MPRLITYLRARLRPLFACRHEWSTTATNGYGHPSEQHCQWCRAYRHKIHDFDTFRHGKTEPWHPGRHPKSFQSPPQSS